MDSSDDFMVQWFGLVNQKNELVRKEADLMYRCVHHQCSLLSQTVVNVGVFH